MPKPNEINQGDLFWSSFSMNSIATGSEFIFSVQEASQGAGQILPVNSGKLLVACS